jgi:hypothetical protein
LLGWDEYRVKVLNEIGPLKSALVLTLNISACYEKLVQKATKHHACIILVLEHYAYMQVTVIWYTDGLLINHYNQSDLRACPVNQIWKQFKYIIKEISHTQN